MTPRCRTTTSILIPFVAVAMLFPTHAAGQTAAILGHVADSATTRPLAGARVEIPSLRRTAISDETGAYTIRNLEPGAYQITVVHLGYRPHTRTVTVTVGSETRVDFALAIAAVRLDELIVTGTGSEVRRKALGNVVETISADDIGDVPFPTISDALGVMVPGMTAMMGGGETGSETSFRLRGAASISRSNEPMIYVDGVRIDNSPDSAGTAPFTISRLDDFHPSDIERVEHYSGSRRDYYNWKPEALAYLRRRSKVSPQPALRFLASSSDDGRSRRSAP